VSCRQHVLFSNDRASTEVSGIVDSNVQQYLQIKHFHYSAFTVYLTTVYGLIWAAFLGIMIG
jgi:hypothetical protein